MVKLLLQIKGIHLNIQDSYGRTALMEASIGGHNEIVELLLSAGAAVNIQDIRGLTALMHGCINKQAGTVVSLLNGDFSTSIDLTLIDESGRTALMFACMQDISIDIIHSIVHPSILNYKCKDDGTTALMFAVQNDHKEILQELLIRYHEIDINACNHKGETALILAAFQGNLDIFKSLLRTSQICINVQSNNGTTALIAACIRGHFEIVYTLIKMKNPQIRDLPLNLHLIDSEGMTAMEYAWEFDNTDIYRSFRESLQVAAIASGDVGHLTKMIRGEDFGGLIGGLKDDKGRTVFHVLAEDSASTPVITSIFDFPTSAREEIMKLNMDLNTRENTQGFTPVHIAALNGHAKVLQTLVSVGADAHITDFSGRTALHLAIGNGNTETFMLLVNEIECDLNAQDIDGCSCVHAAVMCDNLSFLNVLIGEGADVNCVDINGSSPLICASMHGKATILKRLLELTSTDVFLKDKLGRSALDVAKLMNNKDFVKILNRSEIDRWVTLNWESSEGTSKHCLNTVTSSSSKHTKKKKRKAKRKRKKDIELNQSHHEVKLSETGNSCFDVSEQLKGSLETVTDRDSLSMTDELLGVESESITLGVESPIVTMSSKDKKLPVRTDVLPVECSVSYIDSHPSIQTGELHESVSMLYSERATIKAERAALEKEKVALAKERNENMKAKTVVVDTSTSNSSKSFECCVCMVSNVRDCAFVPCGHTDCCYDCGFKLDQCPICMSPISMRVRIYQ